LREVRKPLRLVGVLVFECALSCRRHRPEVMSMQQFPRKRVLQTAMPKGKKTEIPSTIERSEPKAQRTWKKAHDSAIETYGEGQAAHRVAYAALKHQYKKKGDKWVKKDEKGPSDPQAAQGYRDKPKPTARGKVAKTEKEAKVKAKQAAKEDREARKAREVRKERKAA
jgi:cation transport regulator ChaB